MSTATHKIGNITIKVVGLHNRPVYIVTAEGGRVSHQCGYTAIKLMDRETIEFYLDSLENRPEYSLVVDYILGCEEGYAQVMIDRAKEYLAKETA